MEWISKRSFSSQENFKLLCLAYGSTIRSYLALRKKKLWNKWKQNNDDSVEIQYKRQVNKASKAVKRAKKV